MSTKSDLSKLTTHYSSCNPPVFASWYLYIDSENMSWWVEDQDYCLTTDDYWGKLEIIQIANGGRTSGEFPDIDELAALLDSEEITALFTRIFDGSECSDSCERNEDAESTLELLKDALDSVYKVVYCLWDASSYFNDDVPGEISISADTTDGELADAADTIADLVFTEDNVIIYDDLYDYLVSKRDEIREIEGKEDFYE